MASVEQNKKKEDLENYLKELGSGCGSFLRRSRLYIFTESCT